MGFIFKWSLGGVSFSQKGGRKLWPLSFASFVCTFKKTPHLIIMSCYDYEGM
jgi:hypothetical protein